MKHLLCLLSVAAIGLLAGRALAQAAAPYKVLDTVQLMGNGGIDYVTVDSDARRIYVPRGGQTFVFDADTHKYAGAVTNLGGHGVVVDPKSHHGFVSGKTIGMFDTATLQKIKDIPVQSRPDGILFEPFTGRVYVFSHEAPSVTVIHPADGTVVGTVDVGGAMEQAQSDGQGRVYADVEDEKKVAVIDAKTLKVVAKYDLGGTAGEPAGLGLDAKNGILFAMCRDPYVCVVLSAADGKILAILPIGNGTDGGGFIPATMEAFSSQRDGTLTIIKESSPTNFAVEQTVQTKPGCKTSALDAKNNQIVLICTERLPGMATNAPAAPTNAPAGERRGNRGGPGNLDVLFVGR
jgi:DNA-binding beta-propeller fold protein YncE